MSDSVVLYFPPLHQGIEKIARILCADLQPYTEESFVHAFQKYRRIIAVMSMGIVVRKIALLLGDKWSDPAVVVVSPDFAVAIPVLGGHHGANDLARELAPLGIVPVITTATESLGTESVEALAGRFNRMVLNRASTRQVNAAMLEGKAQIYQVEGPAIILAGPGVSFLVRKGAYAVGLGCRKGITGEEVKEAVLSALRSISLPQEEVGIYATTEKKLGEKGLAEGVQALSGNLLYLNDATIGAQKPQSPSRAVRLGLAGVAEPCALAASVKGELVMEKKVFGRVTVAIAR